MSSPPMEFPSSEPDDVEMGESTLVGSGSGAATGPQQSNSNSNTPRQSGSNGANADPLFLAATPSPARSAVNGHAGRDKTPNLFSDDMAPAQSSPLRHVAARRAVGLSTPRRAPRQNGSDPSSPILDFPSSSPARSQRATPAGRRNATGSGGLFSDLNAGSDDNMVPDSDPLEFPSSQPGTPGPQTPAGSRRGDIHPSPRATPSSVRRARTADGQDVGSDVVPPSSAGGLLSAAAPSTEPDEIRAIWGTNVNIQQTMNLFREFIRGFKPKYRISHDRSVGRPSRTLVNPGDAEVPLYETYLRRMRQTGQTNLNVDVINLLAYPPCKKLHGQLLKYPQEVIPSMDQVLKDMMIEIAERDAQEGIEGMEGPDGEAEIADIMMRVYKVRPFGEKAINMRDLNPSDTDKLVTIKGLVIRATPIIPDMKVAFFRCLTCSHTMQVEIDRGRIDEPTICPRDVCQSAGTMSLIHNRCTFADRQVLRLQETPDSVPDGQTPQTVSLCVYDELVDTCKPGDRVEVAGVFRGVPVRVNPRNRTVKSLFKTFLDVVHIRRGSDKRLRVDKSTRAGNDRLPGVGAAGIGGEQDDDDFDEEVPYENVVNDVDADEGRKKTRKEDLEETLRELSRRDDIYDLLARSLAPSIWEMADVKKGILLQLFGGTNKTIARGGGGGGPRYRGDINVLLVGDPGTAKSQILSYVHKIAPRGVYTSGKGSSAVGLTAYVTRDPDTKQLVLESGALVLSDGGVCCIDEFDKMSDATRSVLHEVMEQQTVSIAKAGIITTLNARTSILAAANPVASKYIRELPITKNIDLPPTLISRFDLLYLVLDDVNELTDRRLARHLVGLYLEDAPETAGEDILPLEQLSAYISYAKAHINPTITEEAGKELVKSYVALRNMGHDPTTAERRITATTRQLESMIRLSEAHARMRFSEFVELQDVEEACRLMREAIRTSATDPRTGQIDMDLVNTGVSLQQRRLRGDLKREILALLEGANGARGLKWADTLKQLSAQSSVPVDSAEFSEAVKALEMEGSLKVVGDRERRTIKRVGGA